MVIRMTSLSKIITLVLFSGAGTILILYLVMSSRQETAELNDAVRAEAPGEFLELQHGLTHYWLQGTDTGRLILFIPGGGISGSESFANNVSYFVDKGFRVLTYDLYGRGYSERPQKPNTPDFFLQQLTALVDTLEIKDTFDIVSMSLGSMIALDYASLHPERIRKLVLIDPIVSGDFKANNLLKIPLVSDFLMTVYWYPRALENQRKEFANQKVFENYKKRLAYFMNFEGYKYTNYSTWMNMLTQNKLPLLSKIAPNKILLIYGTLDPFFFGSKNVAQFKLFYPSLKTDSIENAGHIPHLEKPLEVNTKIGDFL